MVHALFPDRLDAGAPCLRQPCPDRAPVGRIRDALDKAVALQVVDEPCDVARRGLHVRGQIPERGVAASVQAKQHAKAALGEAVLLGPALLEQAQHVAGDLHRTERLHGAHVDVEILEELTHLDAVEAS